MKFQRNKRRQYTDSELSHDRSRPRRLEAASYWRKFLNPSPAPPAITLKEKQ